MGEEASKRDPVFSSLIGLTYFPASGVASPASKWSGRDKLVNWNLPAEALGLQFAGWLKHRSPSLCVSISAVLGFTKPASAQPAQWGSKYICLLVIASHIHRISFCYFRKSPLHIFGIVLFFVICTLTYHFLMRTRWQMTHQYNHYDFLCCSSFQIPGLNVSYHFCFRWVIWLQVVD